MMKKGKYYIKDFLDGRLYIYKLLNQLGDGRFRIRVIRNDLFTREENRNEVPYELNVYNTEIYGKQITKKEVFMEMI
jgi:hypothetical protein